MVEKRWRKLKPAKCRYCGEGKEDFDYKDVETLKSYTSERGKISPRRITKFCAKHQRRLTSAIKRARVIALLPFKGE